MTLATLNKVWWTPRSISVVFWLAYLVAGFLLLWGRDFSADSGIALTGAWQISQGERLYRDFVQFHAPGTFYVLGFFFKLFGARYVVARSVSLGLILLSGYGLWLGTRGFLPGWRRYVAPFLLLLLFAYYPIINHNPWGVAVAVWAWLVLEWAHRQNRLARYVAAGVAAGAIVWMMHPKGLMVFGAGAVVLGLRHRRTLAGYAAGFLLALLPALFFWPAPTLWSMLFVLPFRYNRLPLTLTNYAPFLLVLLIVLSLGWQLRRRHAPPVVSRWWWFNLALVGSTAIRPDVYHVVLNSAALAPLVLWLLPSRFFWRGWATLGDILPVALPSIYLLTAVLMLIPHLQTSLPGWSGQTFSQWLRLEDPGIQKIVAEVQALVPASAPIYAGPFLPNLYFETRRHNPTRFDQLITTLSPPEFFAEARRALEADPPALVLLNYYNVEKYRHSQNNPVDAFINERYQVWQRFGGLTLLVPRGDGDVAASNP